MDRRSDNEKVIKSLEIAVICEAGFALCVGLFPTPSPRWCNSTRPSRCNLPVDIQERRRLFWKQGKQLTRRSVHQREARPKKQPGTTPSENNGAFGHLRHSAGRFTRNETNQRRWQLIAGTTIKRQEKRHSGRVQILGEICFVPSTNETQAPTWHKTSHCKY